MAKFGKVEGRITVPSGGWDLALTDQSGGPNTATIPAGTYYHSSAGSGANDFAAEVAARANAVMTQTWSCSVAAGENGTGKYTISCTGTTCTVTFTDTDARDLMGFTGNLSGSTSYTSTNQARHLWLPDCGYQTLNGYDGSTWPGWWETDLHQLESASGYVWSFMGSKKRIQEIQWPAVTNVKAWVSDEGAAANTSFEKFFLDVICGEAAWGTAGGPLRIHYDAADDASYYTYAYAGEPTLKLAQLRHHWTKVWAIASLSRLVQDPSEY